MRTRRQCAYRFVDFARLVACAGMFAVVSAPAHAQTVPSGFAIQSVAGEPFASQPVAFAFLPDGRILVVEKNTGNVRLAVVGSGTSVVVLTIPNVAAAPERGLLGIAVDPAWPQRPYVYFYFTRTGNVAHIVLYRVSGDLTNPATSNLTFADPFVLIDDIPDVFDNHNGGTLRFGPDGMLYASLGDDSRGCDAQDRTVLRGKILRLDVANVPGTGIGPPPRSDLTPADNPFAQSANANERIVYAYGLRNPYRFTIDPWTNDLYIGDVGLETWEEMDELPATSGGANFGWPEFEGVLQDPDPNFADCSQGPFVTPIYVYPNPTGPPVASVVAGPLYRPVATSPSSFPSAYNGDLFLCEFYDRWIRRLERTPVGWALADSVPGQPTAGEWARNLGSIADLQVGPDGALYLLVMIGGGLPRGLHRIVNTLPSDADVHDFELETRFAPNPIRGASGTFYYALGRPEPVTVRLFDPRGRQVGVLRADAAASGVLHWDLGRFRSPGGSGVYFYWVETAAGRSATGKVTVLR